VQKEIKFAKHARRETKPETFALCTYALVFLYSCASMTYEPIFFDGLENFGSRLDMKNDEKEYYPLIKTKIEELLNKKFSGVYLEITADKNFSEILKNKIRPERNIIFNFLKNIRPDITGFIEDSSDFIVIEFKKGRIELNDIYQTKKYRELFNAKFTFLISLEPIPTEIKRLDKAMYNQLLQAGLHWTFAFVLTQFDKQEKEFVEWYPENPFEKDSYWT